MTGVKRYVARPVEVDAMEWRGDLSEIPTAWLRDGAFRVDPETSDLIMQSLEGPSQARTGDYVVRGTAGEFYPVRRPIFEAKYEAVVE